MGQFDQALADVFGFEEADVVANRRMLLSPRQDGVLAIAARQTRRSVPTVLTILAVSVLGSFVFIRLQMNSWSQFWPVAGVIVVACLAVSTLLLRNGRIARSMEAAVVQVVEGPVTAKHYHEDAYRLHVGDVFFQIDREATEVFLPDAVYRFYYADIGWPLLHLLSIEVVRW
jgi:hypothetical protein